MHDREKEMDSMAKRVISKFNNNSERILGIMKKQVKKSSATNDFIFDSMDRNDRIQHEAKLKDKAGPSELTNNPDSLY